MANEEIPTQCPAMNLRDNVERIEKKQDDVLNFMRRQDILFERITYFQKDFEKVRDENKKDHDNMFERLRLTEHTKLDKKDMNKMHTLLWDVLKMALAALLGIAGVKLMGR